MCVSNKIEIGFGKEKETKWNLNRCAIWQELTFYLVSKGVVNSLLVFFFFIIDVLKNACHVSDAWGYHKQGYCQAGFSTVVTQVSHYYYFFQSNFNFNFSCNNVWRWARQTAKKTRRGEESHLIKFNSLDVIFDVENF